eukprot:4191430-Amphidinium_carterae.1
MLALYGPQIAWRSPSTTQCHLLAWSSSSQKRVTRSTFTSELYAAIDGYDEAVLLAQILRETQSGRATAADARLYSEQRGGAPPHIDLAIDNKG